MYMLYYMYTQYFAYAYLLYLHTYSLCAKYLSAVSVNIGIATDTN